MLFNTYHFIIFFACFFVLYQYILRGRGQRVWLIIVGSLFFYGAWDYRFVPLLLFTAMIDYFLAQAIDVANRGAAKRRFLLVLSIFMNLGVLAFFKYSNFFLDNATGILSLFGLKATIPHLDIILPIGISFYTFQSMSYVIDVYRGELVARRRPQEFLAGICFFPHLVAGPIIRATTLLPQFESVLGNVSRVQWQRGSMLFAAGLCKKGMADLLGFYSDRFFNPKIIPTTFDAWIGALAFAGQIYGDFAGYTDMAIGIALFLGVKLPPNFNLPYFATSLIDFWRRWHISLSSWLRDYLYISLGGNRHDFYRNILLTMFLGGLWHGANWTFVIWGAYHGLLLVVTHYLKNTSLSGSIWMTNWLVRIIKIAFNFYLVVIGWVIFRSSSISQSWNYLVSMHMPRKRIDIDGWSYLELGIVVGFLVGMHVLDIFVKRYEKREDVSIWGWGLVGVLLALGLAVSGKSQPFIYFQF